MRYYIGNTEINRDFIDTAIYNIRHWWGRYRNVTLDDVDFVTPGSGGTGGDLSDVLRVGSSVVSLGSNYVQFSSPLPSTSYVVNAYVKGLDGSSQYDLGTVTKAVAGFTVSDVIVEGTSYYHVIMNV